MTFNYTYHDSIIGKNSLARPSTGVVSLESARQNKSGIDNTTPTLLIVKRSYPATAPSAVFDFSPLLGGGPVYFTGHTTYNGNGTSWGPHQLHDDLRTAYDWCSDSSVTSGNLYGDWVFPRAVSVSKIFVVPRADASNFPGSIIVYYNGSYQSQYYSTSISNANGLGIAYSGTGFNIVLNGITAKNWRLSFGGSAAYIGEVEFWGY